MRRSAIVLALALACAACGRGASRDSGSRPDESLLVSSAVSLTEAMTEIGRAYEDAGGARVELNVGASNSLAQRILDGAPVDLFVSADEAQMDRVQAGGRIRAGTRVDLLSNQLVVLISDRAGITVSSVRDLLRPEIQRIAIGDPLNVPAGVYARQYLESAGVWPELQSKVLPTASVRATVVALEGGSVDAAIAYRTDAPLAKRSRVAFIVPIEEGPRITYPAAVVAGGANEDAAVRLLAFLRAPAARRIFERHGFIVKGQ